MSENNNLIQEDALEEDSSKKRSILDIIKIIIAVILLFSIVMGLSFAVLYLTNPKAKAFINKAYTNLSAKKAEKEIKAIKGDTRISELADYYLTLPENDAVEKLYDIKKQDKKLYEKLKSSMDVIDPAKSGQISLKIDQKNEKKNLLQEEYDNMLKEKEAVDTGKSKLYSTLGIRGAIDTIEKDIQDTMDYDRVANTLKFSKPVDTAKILYFMNPIYVDGLKNRFDKDYLRQVDEQTKIYSEFLRKNKSYGLLYDKIKEDIAAKELQDENKFTDQDIATIISNMDYLNAAKILNEFESDTRVNLILQELKNVEDYQVDFDGSLSTVIANSLKVLKKYDQDVDILKKAYEKLQPADLADLADKLVNDKPVYKTYVIDKDRNFRITEKDMAIKALKLIKPQLVADMFSELKKTKRIDKAAQISREIGIPLP